MPVERRTITLEWLQAENACNLEACKKLFGHHTELPLNSRNIQIALEAGILSSNWLARRILTGAEREEYEEAMKPHMMAYERAMSQVLIDLITRPE
jgi:hypothetical protein